MKLLLVWMSTLLIAVLAPASPAQHASANFPVKPVRWVVGFTPGASNDIIARTVGARLSELWGQQFIVDNRPGATGTIGGDLVARAPPDGYTVLLATGAPNTIAPILFRKAPYRVEDFEYVSVVAHTPLIIVVGPLLPVKTLGGLVDYLKANPGKANWGSAGTNSSPHVGLATFEHATGTRFTHVPYKGSAPALIDVASGQIAGIHTSLASADAQLRGGRVRVLAVTGPRRIASLPGVPTLAESGIKDGDALVWFGMAVPLKTPPAIVHKLNAGITQALASPDVNRRMTDLGLEIVGGSAQDANKYVFDEAARLRGLLKAGVLKQE